VRRYLIVACGIVLGVTGQVSARQTPNLTGAWVFDASSSEHRAAADRIEISQSGEDVRVRGFLCCRQKGEIWTTTYYFNEWGPRNATPSHLSANVARRDEKPTQARWDGQTLVLHAGPDLDVRGGSVRIWRLDASGQRLLEAVVNRGLGRAFDFRAASIPTYYARDRHVYVKQ